MKRKFFLVFLFLAVMAPLSFNFNRVRKITAGATYIGELTITSDTVWANKDEPYITDGVIINQGVTLTIMPGVVVKMQSGGFKVDGRLYAPGSPDEKTVFTSIHDQDYFRDENKIENDLIRSGWSSIKISETGQAELNHVLIRYGGNSQSYDYLDEFIRKSFLKFNTACAQTYGSEGALHNYGGELKISSSTIESNMIGVITNDYAYYYYDTNINAYLVKRVAHKTNIRNTEIFHNLLYGIMNNSQITPVDAKYNFWGDNSGPNSESLNPDGLGDKIEGKINFNPWIGKAVEAGRKPVILVPGIMGSYLNKNNEDNDEIWPNLGKMLLSINDDYLNDLVLNASGLPVDNNTIIAPKVIKEIATEDMFQGLIDELEENGYKENEDLFYFPYDWRMDLNDVAGSNGQEYTKTLRATIEEIKQLTGAVKIDIVAHSMGGLVTKAYMQKFGTSSIDKFIDIATPHLGAPKAFKILMYGDNLDIFLLNQNRVKYISQNMPAVYQLLPSLNYFSGEEADNYYLFDMHDLDSNGISGRLNYSETMNFMENTGRNNLMLAKNEMFHDNLDSYSPQAEGVSTYNMVGCSTPTIGQIYILNKEKSGKYEYGLKYINGDGTVPLRSADDLETINLAGDDLIYSASKYYVIGAKHGNMPAMDGVKQFVVSALSDKADSFLFLNYSNLTKEKADCNFSGTQVSFHSPIEMHIYDEYNNHLGPDANGDIETGIDGATYDIIEDNKFVFLPNGQDYKVIGKAMEPGVFNARIETIDDGKYIKTQYFNEVPLPGKNTEVKIELYVEEINMLQIDEDGDDYFEKFIEPSSILTGEVVEDLIKPETEMYINGIRENNDWYISPVTILLSASDNEGGAGILKNEYSLDNGLTWINYIEPISIDQEGQYDILYQSTDNAGNVEETKNKSFKIDMSGPRINIIEPYENQEYLRSDNFFIIYKIENNFSGATFNLVAKIDGKIIDINKAVDLYKFSLGMHDLQISAHNLAGNQISTSTKFNIKADINSTISDIKRSRKEKYIVKELISQILLAQLNLVKKYSESKLVFIYKKLIIKELKSLLMQLDFYYREKWIIDPGYGIIKEDLKYLINNYN